MRAHASRPIRVFCVGFLLCLPALITVSAQALADQKTDEAPVLVTVSSALPVGDIIVSLKDRRLYDLRDRGRAIAYPIATPRDDDLWHGTQIVTMKREWPSWTPTRTMRRENLRLPSILSGRHPLNPMGARALHLGHTSYRIHGTDALLLIGQNASKGCIRMRNEPVIEVFDYIKVITRVTVTHATVATDAKSRSTGPS